MTQELTVVGRIVFGHPGKPRPKKDVRTRQPILKDGQPVQQYVFGLAIDKPTFNANVWPVFHNEARAAFPNGVPQNFSYKFKDGDSVDSKGQPFGQREGYAGHCVLTISTEGFSPQLYKQDQNGKYQQINPEEIKCGDYVAVKLTIKYNGAVSPNTPGLYVNPNGVVHVGYGSEIVSSGQDPEEMFGNQRFAPPPGASAVPLAPTGALPAAMAAPAPQYGAPAPQYAAPAAPAPAPQYAQPPQLPPPAHDFVHNAVAPAAPQQYGAQPQYAPAAPQAPVAGYPGIPTGR